MVFKAFCVPLMVCNLYRTFLRW